MRRIRCQHTKVAVPVRSRRRHQRRNASYQLQRREVQLVDPGATLVRAGLAMLFGAAVHQIASLLAQAVHGKGWAGAVAQQPLQCCAVVCFDEYTGIHRKPAVLVGQHLFGISLLHQTPAHEGAQDASAQNSLHLGHSGLIDSTGWVEGNARWQ